MTGAASYNAATTFRIQTMPGPSASAGAPTHLSVTLDTASQTCRVQFQAEPGGCYLIQSSLDLATWSSVWATNAVGNRVDFSTPLGGAAARRRRCARC